ncbi:MAG: UDP-N-acetylglucosamine 2-epimerase [Clostridiales bacterium]|nr:UDP-N-acetylglucosamine 2-epimerase [Clostridiales bacterium]
MNILLFYASYGSGHLSAATAIEQYIRENYPDAKTLKIDCVEYINKSINKISTSAYKSIILKTPMLWGQVYKLLKNDTILDITQFSNRFMAKKIFTLFEDFEPDLVISCHPLGGQITSFLKSHKKTNCKLATVMTDFASHKQWLIGKDYTDYFFVSNIEMKTSLISEGIYPNKIYVSGIPISPNFYKNYDKENIYKSLNIEKNKKNIIFFGGGSLGLSSSSNIQAILTSLLQATDESHQIIIISGKNQKLYNDFQKTINNTYHKSQIKLIDFTTELPELLPITSFVITKPGGLTITECISTNVPIILINPIPGQEKENAQYIADNKMGIWIKATKPTSEYFQEIFNDTKLIEEIKENQKKYSHINSTKNICDILINENKSEN